MFRGTPQAFATDSKALATAEYGVNNKFDREKYGRTTDFLLFTSSSRPISFDGHK